MFTMISSGVTKFRLDPPNAVDSGRSTRNEVRSLNFSRHVVGFAFVLGFLLARELGGMTSHFQPLLLDSNPPAASSLIRKKSLIYPVNETYLRPPHWMVVTRCSIYDFNCKAQHVRDQQLQKYPLSDEELRDGDNEKWINATILDSNENGLILPMEWDQDSDQTRLLDSQIAKNASLDEQNYLYPPMVSQNAYQKCLELTDSQSTTGQLDFLLKSKVLTPEPDTNMIAFTITDWNYAYDMMHDMIQMADNVIGFSRTHFLVVSIDKETTELACKHGYSVIEWKSPAQMNGSTKENMGKGALRDAVANTKVVLSYEFVKRGIDFFFTEMDVWWVQSPKQSLLKLQQNSDKDQYQMYFSTHQYHGSAINIGVYAARANFKTKLYFEICMELLAQRPDTHDQFVMTEVYNLFSGKLQGTHYQFAAKKWKPNPPETPMINNTFAFSAYLWSPNEIASDERPLPTAKALAFHTLCGTPLRLPHGKKMVARELGVYYGFTTVSNSESSELAGYYQRDSPAYRRYIVLDSQLGTNILWSHRTKKVVEITMSILCALAVHTNRILVMPEVAYETMGGSLYLLWTIMDYSDVEFLSNNYQHRLLDIRETNFMNNRKAWRAGDPSDEKYWPFESVAATALVAHEDASSTGDQPWTIWAQISNQNGITEDMSWRIHNDIGVDKLMDALFAALTKSSEIHNSEVLLVNLDSIASAFLVHFERQVASGNPSPAEKEVAIMHKRLKWCWDNLNHPAFQASASHSCYRVGKHYL